jgi:hypothetical protein
MSTQRVQPFANFGTSVNGRSITFPVPLPNIDIMEPLDEPPFFAYPLARP